MKKLNISQIGLIRYMTGKIRVDIYDTVLELFLYQAIIVKKFKLNLIYKTKDF
jgi:hypothetical protein